MQTKCTYTNKHTQTNKLMTHTNTHTSNARPGSGVAVCFGASLRKKRHIDTSVGVESNRIERRTVRKRCVCCRRETKKSDIPSSRSLRRRRTIAKQYNTNQTNQKHREILSCRSLRRRRPTATSARRDRRARRPTHCVSGCHVRCCR